MTIINKEVKLLTISFSLIFAGFSAIQQFVTPFFSLTGQVSSGFQSLVLIYLFFLLSGPFSAITVSKFGAKKNMLVGSTIYSLYIFSLLSQNILSIYFASSLLGIAASLLWTGQNSYLIRATDEKSYGTNSGFFYSFFSFGSALGVLFLGFLIAKLNFKLPFAIYAFFPLIGSLVLTQLKNLKIKQPANQFKLAAKFITNKLALRLSIFYLSFSFISGLFFGIIPIEITKVLGVKYVGILSSVVFIMPILFSLYFGKLSDIKGRKATIVLSYIILTAGLISMYFSHNPLLLVGGVFLLATNRAVIAPITSALIGDISTEKNLEAQTALLWMAQNIGVISALILSSIVQTKLIYLISISAVLISLVILFPVLKSDLKEIRLKLSQEIK